VIGLRNSPVDTVISAAFISGPFIVIFGLARRRVAPTYPASTRRDRILT
jgi:hypothetical protein